MHEMILCKLGEVVLKGLNRRSFEDKLMANVNRRVAKCGNFRIYAKQSTIYVEPKDENCDIDAAFEGCKKVFGIIAVSKALPCEKDVQKIIAAAKEYLADEMRAAKSFKVESKRADKTFPLTSIQLSQQVGGALHQAFPTCEVNVHDPELVVHIEIRDDSAYVHGPAEEGAGGLPIGMGGVAVSLLSGGIDSPVSSYMIAKRGVKLEMVHFFSPPYTSDEAKAVSYTHLDVYKRQTVTICHSRSENLPEICREADILVVAAGKAGMVGAESVRAGQVVLDVGIHVGADGNLCGDTRYAEVEPVVEAITPVPGGVGTVTSTILASHVVEAAERAANK